MTLSKKITNLLSENSEKLDIYATADNEESLKELRSELNRHGKVNDFKIEDTSTRGNRGKIKFTLTANITNLRKDPEKSADDIEDVMDTSGIIGEVEIL